MDGPCSSNDQHTNQSETCNSSEWATKSINENDDQTDNESLSDLDTQCSRPYSRKGSSGSHSDYETAFQLLYNVSRNSTPAESFTPRSSSSETSLNLINGIDVLLQRLSNERFLELRRIQLGDRPVSGTHARESLENFFQRAIHGPTNEERISEEEQNRPTVVANDVDNLLRQGLVNATLHNDFRNQLERTLSARRINNSAPVRPVPQQRPQRPVGNSQFRSQLESLFQGRIGSNNLRAAPSTTRSTAGHGEHPRVQQSRQTPLLRNRSATVRSNQFQSDPHALPSTNHSISPQNIAHENANRLQITIESGLDILTQTIAEDLNRLQSLQVVSNMMQSNFREELENMVQERVSNIGTTETPDIRGEILRNRRSRDSNSESGDMASEIHNLKRQVEEMKRMMAMSLEVQMDTQRAIKQEVSAVFASFMQQMMAASNTDTSVQVRPNNKTFWSQPPQSRTVAAGQCIICVERSIDSVLYQCGHMCVCNYCGLQLKLNGNHCPMCRAPIRDVIRAYQAQSEQ